MISNLKATNLSLLKERELNETRLVFPYLSLVDWGFNKNKLQDTRITKSIS